MFLTECIYSNNAKNQSNLKEKKINCMQQTKGVN